MEKDERIIEKRFGRRAPFKVPEGYFDSFASHLVESLPERPLSAAKAQSAAVMPLRSNRRPMWKRWASVAAGVCAVVFGAGVYLHQGRATTSIVASSQESTAGYSAVDAMADYAMFDTQDMYAYMSETY